MRVKLLRQAAGRDDRIVAAYEDVTFLNEHVGWYPIIKDRFRKANDIVVVVLRVGDVCFEAGSMFRRGMLRKECIEARTAEARNLRAAVQRRMENLQWIPSSYVAAFEALGWDARPLKGHRARMRELYAAKTDCRFIPNADPLQKRKPRFPYPVVARMPRIDRSLGGKTKIDFQIFTL